MTSTFQKKTSPSKFKDTSYLLNKKIKNNIGIKVRYHTESTEDQGLSILDPLSIPRKGQINLGSTQILLGNILKRGLTYRNKALRTLKRQGDRLSSYQSFDSLRKPQLKKQEKENIKSVIRRSVTRKSTTRKKEEQDHQKWLKQSFNKIVKELKHKAYVRRESSNDKAKIMVQSYGATRKGDKHSLNQDSLCFSEGIFIICDGHGTNGKQISEFVSQTAHKLFIESYNEKKIDTHNIRSILKKVEVELEISGIDISFSGCTFIGIILFENSIFCISIGDSKSILCNRLTTSQLNTLHKPDHPTQKERIQQCGGVIHPLEIGKDKYSGPDRIWAPGRNSWGPGLALSRAFGDKAAKKYGITSDPEIKNIQLSYDADFLVLGSDGLFDSLKDSQISFFIRKKLKEEGYERQKISTDLVQEACRVAGFDSDDTSCIIIFL